MIFRPLGATGIDCSLIGLGTGRLASVSGGISRDAAVRLIGAAKDSGINFIDTADSYAQGQCEKTIGVALQGRRSDFIITSKAGYTFSTMGGGLRLLKPMAKRILKYFKGGKNLAGTVRSNVSRQDFSPQAIRNSVTASLQRLQTDYLDIFLLHSPTLTAVKDAELVDLLRQLKTEGKIRHFGVSSPDAAVLETVSKVQGISVVQTPVNPMQRVPTVIFDQLKAAGIGIIANQIFLSGKLLTGDAEGALQKNQLETMAAKKGMSLQKLLMKYALAQSGVAVVLSGTTKLDHLKQNVAEALSPEALSSEEIKMISGLPTAVG